ncbi:MAG: hypothetical protein QM671_25275 [Bacillus sp. (in: firmicutes)]|uniref:hypothetical protein n=1 Tax=Bacillus sp. TaxID=1409 RepID=UPI0039E5B9C2
MKRMIGIFSTALITGSLLVPNMNAQAATTQTEESIQKETFKWDRHDSFDYMVKLKRGQRSSQSPVFNLDERRNYVQFKIINDSRFSNLEYKLYKMENNGRGPNRAVIIERGTVNRNETKMFDEKFQRGDYYLELESDRGDCEGSAFINILGK